MKKRGKYGQGRVYQPKYKAADGTEEVVQKWYVQYYDKAGIQRREPTEATTEKEARTILGDLRQALLTHCGTNKLKSLDVLSTGEQSIRGLTKLDEFFAYSESNKGTKVKDINNQMWVSGFVEERRKEGVSDATIRNSGALLRQMFKIAASPEFKLLNPSQVPAFAMPKAPKSKQDFATKEEFDKLLKFLDTKFHPYATFLFYQATRKTEAANITWKEINLADAMYYPDSERNKTGDDTPRPLANEVVKILKTVP